MLTRYVKTNGCDFPIDFFLFQKEDNISMFAVIGRLAYVGCKHLQKLKKSIKGLNL